IPPETQFFLADVGEGMYVLVLPLVGNSFRTALWGAEKGAIDVRLESGDPAVKTKLVATSVLISAGTDPFLLLERAFAAAADRLGTFRIRAEKQLPPSLDVFGWCTWDAFYSAVEPQGVKDGLRQLAAGGTPSRMLILDDGWQSTDNDADYRFSDSEVRGDPEITRSVCPLAIRARAHVSQRHPSAHPHVLSTLVRELKSDYGLKYTYCWHALTGYWLGVDPNSPGMARYKPVIQYPCINPHFDYTPGVLSAEPTMAWNPSSFVGAFFNELHQSLHDAGIEGVKCDAQAAITMLGAGYGGGPKITRAYIHAMENSVAEHLDGNCINCMCHPTENIYSFQKTAVARASDDFYPREPASHTVHILNVVYNTLFLGEIVHPDWDMFQSEHPAARLHAAARAVGGCAVYTSDRPDVHDFTLLRKLVLPDGAVLRARLPGRPTRDCLFADPATDGKTGLKVWNRNFHGGVIGAFNLQGACWDRSIRNFRVWPPPSEHYLGLVYVLFDMIYRCTVRYDIWSWKGTFNLEGACWDRSIRNFRVWPLDPPPQIIPFLLTTSGFDII
ncbi:raffinose synthase, partial [Baffinella frigidus]